MLVSPVTLILDHAQNRIALRDPRLALPFTYPLLAATGSTLGQTMSVYTFLSQPQARDSRSHVLFSSLSSVESGGAEALKTCFFLSVYTVVQSPEGPGPSFFCAPPSEPIRFSSPSDMGNIGQNPDFVCLLGPEILVSLRNGMESWKPQRALATLSRNIFQRQTLFPSRRFVHLGLPV